MKVTKYSSIILDKHWWHYDNFQIIEMHLNYRITDVTEPHMMGCDGKEGNERYMAEGIVRRISRNIAAFNWANAPTSRRLSGHTQAFFHTSDDLAVCYLVMSA